MTPDIGLIVIGVGLYFLKRWLAEKVIQHPELQTVDALDRMLHCVLVVGTVWIAVSLVSSWLFPFQVFSEFTDPPSN